jgi:hypothetical protein
MFRQTGIVCTWNGFANTSATRLLMATQGGAGAFKAIVGTFDTAPAIEL